MTIEILDEFMSVDGEDNYGPYIDGLATSLVFCVSTPRFRSIPMVDYGGIVPRGLIYRAHGGMRHTPAVVHEFTRFGRPLFWKILICDDGLLRR